MAKKVNEKDFKILIKENIEATQVERKRSNKINDYKEYLNDTNILGKGAFGKIYKVKDHDG